MNLKVYDINAKEVGKIELNDSVFAVDYNKSAIHQVVVAHLANCRQGTKATLNRSAVRGGGAKPWRQKGTGRARQGTIRAPQWKGGGVVFAHQPRDFSKKVNKKLKELALKSALSEKIRNNEVIVVDKFDLKEAKTKHMANVLKNFEINKKTYLLVGETDANVTLASRNLALVTTSDVNLINVYDIVSCNKLIISKDTIKKLEEAYAV